MSRLSLTAGCIAALWLAAGCTFSERTSCDAANPCAVGRCENGVCVREEGPAAANGGRGGRRATPTGNSETPGDQGGSGAMTGTTSNPAMMSGGSGGAGGARMTTPNNPGGRDAGTDSGMSSMMMMPMTTPPAMGECKATDAARSCNIGPGCDGMQRCVNNMWGSCEAPADRVNTPELCNGIDDNCNGTADEDVKQACYPAGSAGCTQNADGTYACKGVCAAGMQTCVNGQLTDCAGYTTPKDEVCQVTSGDPARDENCDGTADENCNCTGPKPCYDGAGMPGIGQCKQGMLSCVNGHSDTVCVGEVVATLEICNGQDDDCNGVTDDVLTVGTMCNVPMAKGVCLAGTMKCVTGNPLPQCVSNKTAGAETCNNMDDDCNGMTDDVPGVMTDPKMCGGCGKPACTGAASSCCAGGCVDLQTDTKNCGMCGKACPAGDTCSAGACKAPMMMGGAGASGASGSPSGGAGASAPTGGAGGATPATD